MARGELRSSLKIIVTQKMLQYSKRKSYFFWQIFLLAVVFVQTNSAVSTVGQVVNFRLEGRVRDEMGAAVVGARVELRSGSGVTVTTTSQEGTFIFTDAADGDRLVITASGFAEFSRLLKNDSDVSPIEIQLLPAALREQVTVTATRTETPLSATAASVRLISTDDLSTTAALTIDDALRQVPGFQLFRRSGSRVANPTSQGVSLRGVGASGASRALVLADGIPFMDPFGGWVYWDRLPSAAVGQVEIVRGGASDLYGSNALGGVINIITQPGERSTVRLESSYGSENTSNVSMYAGRRLKRFSLAVAGEVFGTDGYINVRKSDRGAIDEAVSSHHRSSYFQLGFRPRQNIRLFLRPSYFVERRANGTPLQTNRTHIREVDGGVDWSHPHYGESSFRGYLSAQTYDQNFSAIASDRNLETLTRLQRVPAQAAGLIFQWTRPIERHNLVGGFEAREVRGASDEIAYDRGNPSSFVDAGGRQRSYGVFFRDTFQLRPNFSISAGTRIDLFKNTNGLSVSRGISLGAPQTVMKLPGSSEFSVSPYVSVLYRATRALTMFGSVNRAFREPTLNELYRSFRLGNVLTLANEKLRREQASNVEGGLRLSFWRDRFNLRTSIFSTSIANPIANVTLTTSPALVTRKRLNLGQTRSQGIEVETNLSLKERWQIGAGYLFANARVHSFSANTSLEGLLIPQTPRHSFTLQTRYLSPHYRFGLQGRISGSHFEDDQNTLPLRGFFNIDGYAARSVNAHLELFLASENLFNSRYDVGRTPVITQGPPALVRLGLKIKY
jgi:outer membrane receptor protein involved in Fe transport